MRHLLSIGLLLVTIIGNAQNVLVTIDPTQEVKPISPYLYGRNNNLPTGGGTLTAAQWTQLKDSGVQFLREGGGNNSTKYNWKKGLSSHPDWYNNVYSENWDNAVKLLHQQLPASVAGMWTFQLIGKVASNTNNNFNDWGYNNSQWWSGVAQNLAGGGVVNPAGGSTALVKGNPNLYLKDWNADSTVGILDHWRNTLKIPESRITYWNMDNEPEIWHGTHDDIVSSSLPAETYMQSYFAVAKKARAKFPNIKLVGPVPANEWQWYNWMNKITYNGKYYCWLEYFIKRCAEEQAASGVRMLDVLDIHFYPGETAANDMLQVHRVFFDRTYDYPGANGVKSIDGGWNTSYTKEYIFGRVNDWLAQYFGPNHGVKLGLTETDIQTNDAAVVSVWYASMLGEFMKNGVELFTPWSWKPGMWETVHLFSRYNQGFSVQGTSSEEQSVSAYPSVNASKTQLTIVLVNRSTTATKNTNISFKNFNVANGQVNALRLSALPGTETFVSHSQNALKTVPVTFSGNAATLSLPPLSITSLTLSSTVGVSGVDEPRVFLAPNPARQLISVQNLPSLESLELFDAQGQLVRRFEANNRFQFDIADLPRGFYVALIRGGGAVYVERMVKM